MAMMNKTHSQMMAWHFKMKEMSHLRRLRQACKIVRSSHWELMWQRSRHYISEATPLFLGPRTRPYDSGIWRRAAVSKHLMYCGLQPKHLRTMVCTRADGKCLVAYPMPRQILWELYNASMLPWLVGRRTEWSGYGT